jgi:hypothetical protein
MGKLADAVPGKRIFSFDGNFPGRNSRGDSEYLSQKLFGKKPGQSLQCI